jgi:hypothetical protein
MDATPIAKPQMALVVLHHGRGVSVPEPISGRRARPRTRDRPRERQLGAVRHARRRQPDAAVTSSSLACRNPATGGHAKSNRPSPRWSGITTAVGCSAGSQDVRVDRSWETSGGRSSARNGLPMRPKISVISGSVLVLGQQRVDLAHELDPHATRDAACVGTVGLWVPGRGPGRLLSLTVRHLERGKYAAPDPPSRAGEHGSYEATGPLVGRGRCAFVADRNGRRWPSWQRCAPARRPRRRNSPRCDRKTAGIVAATGLPKHEGVLIPQMGEARATGRWDAQSRSRRRDGRPTQPAKSNRGNHVRVPKSVGVT